jgi:RNA polymerase subunit RPABC4/transcription elongation factor Spt4
MHCTNCGNKVTDGAKYCNHCGKPVDVEKSEIKPIVVDTEKIQKSLKNTGNSVYAIGWLTIIVNVAIYIWSVLDKSYAEYGLPAIDLSGAFLMVVAAIIFIILGNRIRKLVDKNIKLYLQILLGLSILILIWVISTGGRVGILFFLVIAYLISSLIKINKAMKSEGFTSSLVSPKYTLDKRGWIIFSLAALVLFIVAVAIDLSYSSVNPQIETSSSQQEAVSNTSSLPEYSKTDLIKETVAEIKKEMTIPDQVDEVTRIIDITAEPSAIRYHYTLSGVDTSQLSNAQLKSHLQTNICQNPDTKTLLNEDINMEYSYLVDTGEKYFVQFTKSDCY